MSFKKKEFHHEDVIWGVKFRYWGISDFREKFTCVSIAESTGTQNEYI